MLESHFNQLYEKETPAQVLSGEHYQIFKYTYFEKALFISTKEILENFASNKS